MYAPSINKKKKKKPAVHKSQATFNRQLSKIKNLKKELHLFRKECEEALALYHSALRPKQKETGAVITQFILKVQELTQQNPKVLNKKEQQTVKEILENSLEHVFSLLPYGEIDDKLKSLYEKMRGKSFKNEFQAELESFKKMFEEMRKEHPEMGKVDMDFSKFKPEDNLEDLLAKFAESMEAAMHAAEKHEKGAPHASLKEKSEQELLKEKHARDLEELKNKGLGAIYKRLAKKLHPDLEQDEEKRVEKDHLMKRLSLAYNDQDLVSLLAIQSEYAKEFDEVSPSPDEGTIKIYNSILKDQIEELKHGFVEIVMHPRYLELHRYIEDRPEEPVEGIKEAIEECEDIGENYSSRIKDLSGKQPMKSLKEILESLISLEEEEEFFGHVFDSMIDELMFSNSSRPSKKKKNQQKR